MTTTITPKQEPRMLITEMQWGMPVSVDDSGRFISLQEFAKGKSHALSFSSLSPTQRAEVAAKRIELQPNYEVVTIGAGVINKERALEEVRAQTSLGRTLIEIEIRVILNLLEEIEKRGN